MLRKLWNDEAGSIVSAEVVLVATILVVGAVTGLTSVRDAVVTELADVGKAIANVDQSFTVTDVLSHSSATASFGYSDGLDFCDTPGTGAAGPPARCLVVTPAAAIGPGGDDGSTP